MSKSSNRLGTYTDVRAILDAALAAGGGEYTLETYGAAVHWTQRAYRFRKAYAAATYPDPSPYDTLKLRRVEPNTTTVYIEINKPKGTFTPKQTTPDFSLAQQMLNDDIGEL